MKIQNELDAEILKHKAEGKANKEVAPLFEIWLGVAGYEGLYQISNLGRVKSLISEIILKPILNPQGYWGVGLCKDGGFKSFRVHRLVAAAFIRNDFDRPFVNHLDGNKQNNDVFNLEWVTHEENCIHAHAVLQIKCGPPPPKPRQPYTGFVWKGYLNINTMEQMQPIDIEIAKYRGEGKPVKEIASLVNLPGHTVKYRIARMLKALSCANSAQLLLKMAKMNLI